MPRKKEGGEGGQKYREDRNGKGRMPRVKCRGSEITHIFFNKLLRELPTFFRIQPCYLSGNVDGNQGEIYYRFGSKQPFMGRRSETISNLRCLIKHSWMVRGSVEKGHLFWKNKTKLQENRSVELYSSNRTSSEKISATQTIYLL